jgi:hypothetical protein
MQTVVETPAFLASAEEEGLSPEDRQRIVDHIAHNPKAGELMPGTGGARKVRFAGRSKGKNGGYRVVTFFGGDDIPVFLIDVYGKDTQANLSKTERNELRRALTALPREWRESRAKRSGKKEFRK